MKKTNKEILPCCCFNISLTWNLVFTVNSMSLRVTKSCLHLFMFIALWFDCIFFIYLTEGIHKICYVYLLRSKLRFWECSIIIKINNYFVILRSKLRLWECLIIIKMEKIGLYLFFFYLKKLAFCPFSKLSREILLFWNSIFSKSS